MALPHRADRRQSRKGVMVVRVHLRGPSIQVFMIIGFSVRGRGCAPSRARVVLLPAATRSDALFECIIDINFSLAWGCWRGLMLPHAVMRYFSSIMVLDTQSRVFFKPPICPRLHGRFSLITINNKTYEDLHY